VRVQLWTPQAPNEEELELVRRIAEFGSVPPKQQPKGFWSKVREALGA
jgi:hypothetical protein